MLNLNNIKGPEAYDTGISYHGANFYRITGGVTKYILTVTYMDDDGDIVAEGRYTRESLSAIIAIMEEIEANGHTNQPLEA